MGAWTTRLAAAVALGASLVLAACNDSTPSSDLVGSSSGGTSSGGTSSGGASSGGTSSGGTSSGGTSSGGTSSGGTSSGGTSSGGTSSGGTSSGGTSSGGTSSGGTSSGGTSSGGTSSGGSSSGGVISTGSAGLIPLVTAALSLDLVDPTMPLGTATNPLQVDTSLPSQGFGAGKGVVQSLLFQAYTINSGTGATTNIQNALLAYFKGGSIFTVNLTSPAPQTPTQVSAVTDGCGFSTTEGAALADYSAPANSWVLIDRTGPDGTCFTSDDTLTFVKLSEAASGGDLSVPNFEAAVALRNASGAIVGFMDGESNGNTQVLLVQRNAVFQSPVVLFTANSTPGLGIAPVGLDLLYVTGSPSGPTTTEGLYRYSTAAGSLSASLYTFAATSPFAANPAADANNFYFADNGEVQQIPRSATTSGKTTLLVSLNSNQIVRSLFATAQRVVGSSDDGVSIGDLFSLPIGVTSPQATLLQGYTIGANRTLATIEAVDPAGFVYINTQTPNAGTVSNTAISMADSGAGAVSTPTAQWVGLVTDNALASAEVSLEPRSVGVVLDTLSNISGSFATHSFTVYNSATQALSAQLGSISAAASFQSGPIPFVFGTGRYAGLTAGVEQNSAAAQDAYLIDVLTANSLTAVSTDAGPDIYIYP